MDSNGQLQAVRTAVAALMTAALGALAADDNEPSFTSGPDHRRWRRQSQESFLARNPRDWQRPRWADHYQWLDTFAEMAIVRAAFDAHEVLRTRMDSAYGVASSRQGTRLSVTLMNELLAPMVHRIGKYSFDEVTFDEAYTRLEDALLADKIRLVEWVPLVGFDATTDVPQVQLPDDVVLQRMTNNQISDAIGHHAVPAEFAGGPNSVTVSRLDQWALTRERAFPICQADPGTLTGDEIPQTPSFPALEAALIAALRIVSGGSVAATRALRARHDDDFLMADGPTVSLSMVPTTVRERPTVLLGNDLEQLHQVIGWLRDPTVVNNRALQTAIRRLVVAGSQHLAGDRLIDLMICAEVLFLKTGQTARTRRAKGKPIAEGAATLLTHDAALSASHSQIYAFMDEAYQRRNDETHGDDPEEGNLLRLDGGPATGASEVADDLEKVLRRATYVIIQQAVAPASRMMG